MTSNTTFLLFVAGAAALGVYVMSPRLQAALPQSWGQPLFMRLDTTQASEIDDRRGGGRDIDVGDGAPPWPGGGQGGGMPGPGPWDQAAGEDGPPRGPGGRGGMRCRDLRTGHDVPMAFCDREDAERGRGHR